MSTASEKGTALENAVAAIEHHILATSPALKEKTFIIETKKIITVNGVHHEIDIFVTIDLGDGYKSVFIFECKNWQEPVGKNDLIVFEKKIEISHAQHGYFVAKSFSKDARYQAEANPRISLLTASEHDPTTVGLPDTLREFLDGFHSVVATPEFVETAFYARGRSHSNSVPFDVATARAIFQGTAIDLAAHLRKWAEETASRDLLSFQSATLPEGEYARTARSRCDFAPNEFVVNDLDIEYAGILVRYKISLFRQTITSHFEVKTRGRVVTLGAVQIPDGPSLQLRLACR